MTPRKSVTLTSAATRFGVPAALALALLSAPAALAEDRSIDGSGNNITNPAFANAGVASELMIRFGYETVFPGDRTGSTILTAPARANPRDISNRLSNQTSNLFNARNLSDFAWSWGQFLDHDMSISRTNANDTANIPVTNPNDPLASPFGIPFARSEFEEVLNLVDNDLVFQREQRNEITSYIDASNVYGSSLNRANTLRGRTGRVLNAKLLAGPNDLLPENTFGLDNDNGPGLNPPNELFVAGDIRVNENFALTSLHTVFHREHNRLVDVIAAQQPNLNSEEQYQLARKIVGAQMQIITYNEFLPALFGNRAPAAEDFEYDDGGEATVTNSFAHAVYRFGHSMLASQLQLVDDSGQNVGTVELSDAFFNPDALKNDPSLIDQTLKGMSTQRAQEIDVQLVDDVRNRLFGPPGAGGLDLASLNIQRGRDHGLPDYNELRRSYGLLPEDAADQFGEVTSFAEITSDPELQEALEELYGSVDNIDAWVGALAEDHLPGSSVGEFGTAVMVNQFERLRDHDRLFYLSEDAGLYTKVGDEFVLDPMIASIIDLDNLTLASVIMANTDLTSLHSNVFFAIPEPASLALVAASLFGASCVHRRRARC